MIPDVALSLEMETLPEWLRILPLGRVELVDGREPFEVDRAALERMAAAFRSRGVDLVIDYEHQSLQGGRAPAAGWIKVLEAREDGLWARVEWTAQAQEYLRHREYRYFSPVLRLDQETRKPEALLQVALTNVPAIKELAPVVAKVQGDFLAPGGAAAGADPNLLISKEEEKTGMREQLKTRLGLAQDSGEDCLWAGMQDFWRNLALRLDLGEEASTSQVLGAVEALKAGAAHLGGLKEELTALKARLEEEGARQAVAEALQDGKITPAQQTWALEYCRQDPEGFKTYVAKVPQIVPLGLELKTVDHESPEASLAPEYLAICRQLNITPAQYRAAEAQINQP